MRVRHYTPGDFRTVLEIFQRAVHEGCAEFYSSAQLAAWAPHPPDVMRWVIELAIGMVWVCDDADGTPVGFIHIDRDGVLRQLYVEPRFEGTRVASRLMQTAMDWANDENLDSLRTETIELARPFFERHGFQLDDECGEHCAHNKAAPKTRSMRKSMVTTTSDN